MDPYVQGMAIIRLISSVAELAGAILMLKYRHPEAAIRVNALLGLVGPLVLMSTMAIGLMGLSGKLSLTKILMVFTGVFLIFWGTR